MKPLKLELEGFTAFRRRTTIDFAALDLFAITGPTGAGKSSLIDAICYALYGRVPRVNAEIAACISQGQDRLQVTLEFQAASHLYRVFRETRRKGAPNVRLEYWLPEESRSPATLETNGQSSGPDPFVPSSSSGQALRLSKDKLSPQSPNGAPGNGPDVALSKNGRSAVAVAVRTPDTGEWHPLAQGAHDVTSRIEHIVGLTYDGFTRSVLLPQGQFEEFLAGSPDKRRDVLRSLLRLEVYEQMRDRSARLAGEYRAALNVIETSLTEQYADATPAALADRQAQLAAANAETDRLAGVLKDLALICTAADRFEAAQAEALLSAAEAAAIQGQLDHASSLLKDGNAEIEALGLRLGVLDESLQANTYDDELLAVLAGAANLATSLERDEKALAVAEADLKRQAAVQVAAEKAAAGAEAKLASAARGLSSAQRCLDEARRHDLAAALQAGLAPGDSCPVCGGTVGELPEADATALAAAEKTFVNAETVEQEVRKIAQSQTTAAAVAAAQVTAASEQAARLSGGLADRRSELESLLPGFPDRSAATISLLLRSQRAAREERDRLRGERKTVDSVLQAKHAELAEARTALAVLTDRAGKAADAVVAAQKDRAAALICLESALAGDSWPELTAALTDGRPLASLAASLRDCAVAAEREALTTAGRLSAEVERIAAAILAAENLRAEKKRLEEEHGVAADLGQMLMANRFQAFVQAEALRLLAQDGSEKLRQLSAGRYTLAVSDSGQEFEVIDEWNAGDRRSVRTLSGGETFLASLALALALAETLPGIAAGQSFQARTLDSVFLDEGFGSLDAESLRLAADALDTLRTGGRMVCVVTHLSELAERLPARIEVTKSETGSTAAIA